MRGDGLAFAVRIRRQINVVGRERQLLQLGQDLFFTRDDDVFGFEFVVDIDTEIALGQIFHMAERSFDRESLAQIFLDGFRLGGRFDDDETFGQIQSSEDRYLLETSMIWQISRRGPLATSYELRAPSEQNQVCFAFASAPCHSQKLLTKFFPGSCRILPFSSSSNRAAKSSDDDISASSISTSWSM